MSVTVSEARKSMFGLIEQVNNDRTEIEITSKRGDAVLISRAELDARSTRPRISCGRRPTQSDCSRAFVRRVRVRPSSTS